MALIQRTVQNLPTQVRGKLVNNALKLMREASFPYRKLMAYHACAMMEVETKLNVLNEEFSLQYDRNPISSIKTRLKSFDSIIGKLQRKGLPMDDFDVIEQSLNDIAGVRVICSFPEDVYMLAEALLKQDDIRLLERKGLHCFSQGQRLPQSAPDRRGTYLFGTGKAAHEGRGAVAHHCHGFLGQLRASAEIQKRVGEHRGVDP